jgi:hypothetical protein
MRSYLALVLLLVTRTADSSRLVTKANGGRIAAGVAISVVAFTTIFEVSTPIESNEYTQTQTTKLHTAADLRKEDYLIAAELKREMTSIAAAFKKMIEPMYRFPIVDEAEEETDAWMMSDYQIELTILFLIRPFYNLYVEELIEKYFKR